jgi:hypothetical protein
MLPPLRRSTRVGSWQRSDPGRADTGSSPTGSKANSNHAAVHAAQMRLFAETSLALTDPLCYVSKIGEATGLQCN